MSLDINTRVTTSRDNWGQFASAMDSATADALASVAHEGAGIAQSLAPPALAGTFESWPSGRIASTWGSSHQWADGLNYGIPPHSIGRPGQFLHNKETGFRARGPVLHPGYEGDHFLERSFEAVQRDIVPKLREEVRSQVLGM